MAINWNLAAQQPNFADRAARGLELGTQLKMRAEERDKKKKGDAVYEKINTLMRNPDFNLMASNELGELMKYRPDLVEGAMIRYEGMSNQRKKQYEKDFVQAKNLYEAGDVQGAMDVFGDRIVDITQKGGMPDDSIRAMQIFRANPDRFVQGVNTMLQMETGKDFGANASSKPAAIQSFESLVKAAGLTKDEAIKAAKIELGLEERAVGSAMQTIANDPKKVAAVAAAEAEITGTKKQAELIQRMELEPSIQAAVTSSVAQAKAAADRSKEARSNDAAWNVYQIGMGGLVKSLGDTSTGNVAGLIPALTGEAKTAEGAIAIMRPIIKDVVRSAGEGTFTDQDQKLIDQMIPSRSDTPESIAAKIEMLDMYMRAKLKIGNDVPLFEVQSNGPQAGQNGVLAPQPQQNEDDEFSGFQIIN